ncbi:GNAT family N-acetyltransferase [Bosea sp. AAP35]|uniref:GNAT family N-acetyltransferase n=1 Tax=Bosea sp. AAP35 TaxID=1523417 RepID=UPI0006B8832B|nr:GNAT family N-acetyltransferase [Bosea sp. AAP35]
MTATDLPAVMAVAAVVHPDYPEDEAVFAERLRLCPQGCLVLEGAGGPIGYVVAHPWHCAAPPALNSLLGALPMQAGCFYIHDLALLPAARGSGAGGMVVARLAEIATDAGLSCLALVAIDGSLGFWRRQGFHAVHDPALAKKLASYDDAACYLERALPSGAPAGPAANPTPSTPNLI